MMAGGKRGAGKTFWSRKERIINIFFPFNGGSFFTVKLKHCRDSWGPDPVKGLHFMAEL